MIVLLHGFTGCPAAWDEVRARLGEESLAPPLFGHHPSQLDERGFLDEVDRLAALVPDGAHLVGYSLGARLALALLARHPRRVRRATLVGVHPGLPDEERAARAAADERWAGLAERDLAAFVDAWEAQPLFATQAHLPAPVRERQRRQRLAHSPTGIARALRRLGLAAMPPIDSSKVAAPVTLVAGAADEKFVAVARHLVARLPRASLTVVDGAGHNVALEQPARLAQLMEEP